MKRFNLAFVAAPLALGLSFPGWAQDEQADPAAVSAPVAALDPTAQDADVAFGAPEPVVIVSGDEQHTVMAEIATTDAQMQRGLMWRESLAEDSGMLFRYEPPRRASMWMENTLIDLDLVFIQGDGTIFKIVGYAQAGSRRSLGGDAIVAGVLELPAGRAFALGLRPGDVVRHAFFDNADAAQPAGEAAASAVDDAQDAEDGTQ